MELDKGINFLKENEDVMIKFASEMIRIPSINPPGDVTEAAKFVKEYLNKWGIDINWFEPQKGRVTLLSSIGDGEELLMLNGHIDVVPPGDLDKWRFPPFSGEIRDGYLYGRGASDMKGPLAALIYAYIAFYQFVKDLNVKISLSIVPDEETGGAYGAKYLVYDLGHKPRYVMIAEPSTIYAANIGEKGIIWFKFNVYGTPGHASMSPYVGDNAILKANSIINDLYKVVDIDFEPPSEIKEVAIKSGELIATVTGVEELKRIFYSLSCNVGIIKGGVKVNVIAPKCEFEVDMRVPHGVKIDDVINIIKKKIDKYKGVNFEIIAKEEPNYTSPNSILLKKLSLSVKEELDIDIIPTLIMGATDGRYFRSVGSDVIIYGPAEWNGIHGYNERVNINELKAASRVYLRTIHHLINNFGK